MHLSWIFSAAILSLIVWASLYILDIAKVCASQKMIFLKISLVMAVLLPILFNLNPWPILEETWPTLLLTPLSSHSSPMQLPSHSINWSFYSFIAYIMGFSCMIAHIVHAYLSTKVKLQSSHKTIIQGKTVFLHTEIKSPCSFGFPRARIFLPVNIEEKWTPREIELCLAHEQIHVNQHDNLWKAFSLFIRALLFFAPWSYLLHKKFELEMEMACDERTCAATHAHVEEYGNLLLTMATYQFTQNIVFNNISNSTIKRRLLAMKSKTKKRSFLISLLGAAMLLAGSTAIATTSGLTDKKSVYRIISKVFIDGKLVTSPTIVAHADQKATIVISNASHDRFKMSLVANEIAKGRININYDIHFKHGKHMLDVKPQIVVSPHEEGRINLLTNDKRTFSMSVLAERE